MVFPNLVHFFPRSEKWNENLVHSFREWKVKWKYLDIENEKWNENASRSRSRSEIGKKFSRILEKRDSRRLLVQSVLQRKYKRTFNTVLTCGSKQKLRNPVHPLFGKLRWHLHLWWYFVHNWIFKCNSRPKENNDWPTKSFCKGSVSFATEI